jgi:hypothetical protein
MSYLPVGQEEGEQERQQAYRKIDRALHAEQFELLEEILEFQKRQARKHRIELMIAAGGALFAAIRLGIIWAPKVKRRRQLGKLGQ